METLMAAKVKEDTFSPKKFLKIRDLEKVLYSNCIGSKWQSSKLWKTMLVTINAK